jgi:hypothetical protein
MYTPKISLRNRASQMRENFRKRNGMSGESEVNIFDVKSQSNLLRQPTSFSKASGL